MNVKESKEYPRLRDLVVYKDPGPGTITEYCKWPRLLAHDKVNPLAYLTRAFGGTQSSGVRRGS